MHTRLTIFWLTALTALFCVSCGGGGITFPQGPISGANSLGFQNPTLHLESEPDFSLTAEFNAITDVFSFQWTQASESCNFYRVVIVVTPTSTDPGITSAIAVRVEGDTGGLSLDGGTVLTDFLDNSSVPLSALVLCVDGFIGSQTVYRRSTFVSLSEP